MVKKIRLKTISLGSEPYQPDIEELTGFIRTMKGQEVDLISYYLTRSLKEQVAAGISSPAGGGLFMQSRFERALTYSPEECHVDPSDFVADAKLMTYISSPVWSVLPAPSLIQGSPDPDDEEEYARYCDLFSRILRSMRDHFISGHIFLARDVFPIDVEFLASQKTTFLIPDGTMEAQSKLLEFQSQIALTNNHVSFIDDLIDQYEIRTLILIDPSEEGYKIALKYLDPDQILVGGYGSGSEKEYWKKVAEGATTNSPD